MRRRRGRGGSSSVRHALVGALALAVASSCGGNAPSPDDAIESAAPDEGPTGVFGRAPEARGGAPSVILLRPRPDGDAPRVDASAPAATRDTPAIDQFGLAFSPGRLLLDVGARVTFTNSEGALTHNVHLRHRDTDVSVFNDDASAGDELSVTLEEPGGYDVLCDMHPGMTAFIFASAEPYAVFAEEDGSFRLGPVPEGTYEIFLWTASDGLREPTTLEVVGDATEVDLRPSG